MRTVVRAFLRTLPRRKGLSLLQFLGIACGVAGAVGLILSARAALAGFSSAVDFLGGRATHAFENPAGPLDESVLKDLASDPAVVAFSPVIDRRIRIGAKIPARLLGIEPFLDRFLRPEIGPGTPDPADPAPLAFLTESDAVFIDAGLARAAGAAVGDRIRTSRGSLLVRGIFPNSGGEPLVLMDIAQAQERLGLRGRVDRVDLILGDEAGFRTRWESRGLVRSGEDRKKLLAEMLASFTLNLRALSLMALFIGVFLVFNTTTFAAVTRRRDAGILRSIGASRAELAAAFLAEILILAVAGGAAGGVLGYGLSRILAGRVAATINVLYFFVPIAPPAWSFSHVLWGIVLGGGAGLAGALVPLAGILRSQPVQAMSGRSVSRSSPRRAGRIAAAGAAVIVLGTLILLAPGRSADLGFAGTFVVIAGASLVTGWAIVAIHPALRRFLRRLSGLTGLIAEGNIRFNLVRTSVAVAAFFISLSMTIGLSSMIGSFRESLRGWMAGQISGDLYVSSLDDDSVPPAVYETIRSLPGVGGADPYRNVAAAYAGTTIFVNSVDAAVLGRFTRFAWVRGGPESWAAVRAGDVIVSESFSRRFSIGPGDAVDLPGRNGPARLRVAAVFFDYTSDRGVVMMDRSTYLRVYGDPTIDSLAVFIDAAAADREQVLQTVRGVAEASGLSVVSGAGMHEAILGIFDSTFAVTRAMRLIAILVAFFGIAGALLTLFLEREKDFGIYRALGFSAGQISVITLLEGLIMGFLSFLLSLGLGTAMAFILIKVINARSFHWTIFFHPQAGPYLEAALVAFVGSLVAAAYPVFRARKTYPQIQIREE